MLNIENQYNPQNSSTTNNENYEMHYWSVMLGCTMEELSKAMEGVGASESQVKLYLKTKKFSLKYSSYITFKKSYGKLS